LPQSTSLEYGSVQNERDLEPEYDAVEAMVNPTNGDDWYRGIECGVYGYGSDSDQEGRGERGRAWDFPKQVWVANKVGV